MDQSDPEIVEVIARYNTWRRIYGYAGKAAPDEPDWEKGRLYFRDGYPYPDWSALIIDATAGRGYRVLSASTERRETPSESSEGTFARIQDAGKYIIYEVADTLRIACGVEPITWKWRAVGLDPRVDKVIISEDQAKYVLRTDPTVYFLAYSGGIQPYNHILTLSYDELNTILLQGFPESVASRMASESS